MFDNRGVGRTEGVVPDTMQGWADDVVSFIEALRFKKVDLLGYSMGARAVQFVAVTHPDLVRKMILAGASPLHKTPDTPTDTRNTKYVFGMARAETYEEGKEAFKLALFGESKAASDAFESYWRRLQERTVEPLNLDLLPLDKGGQSQITAMLNADAPENTSWPDRLAGLGMPVLVANGNNDLTLGLVRSLDLLARIKNSQLVIYPNSGHGFLWQYAALFADQVNMFLDTDAFDKQDYLESRIKSV